MENRRLLLAALLSAALLVAWNLIFPPAQPPVEAPPEAPPRTEQQREAAGDESGAGTAALEEAETPEEGPEPTIAFGSERVAAEMATTVTLENARFRAELSNEGAELVSFVLKQHSKGGGDAVDLVRKRGRDPYPFALAVDGEKSHPLNRALWEWERREGELRMRHRSERGAAEKRFRFTERGLLEVEVTVLGERDWGLVVGPGVRNPSEAEAENRFLQPKTAYLRMGESETIEPKKQEAVIGVPGAGLGWVALEDNFFLTAVIPQEGLREVLVRPVLERRETQPEAPRFLPLGASPEAGDLRHEQLLILQAEGERMRLLAFFGAKRYAELAALPYGLEETVRFGFFGFLARPLYYGLEWIHERVVANYGWAIVLMTFLIKLVFFPLTHKSQVSMGKMQELNPKVQAIRSKYRGKLKDKQGRPNMDAQRQMNEEVMAVYRSAGVNPVSGCFPMLLQIPVFFAFFRLLSVAVELRNAPWILWVRDLSAPDPYWILPLAMGGTSFLLQRMTPAAPDPMQRRLMQVMPVMFTVFAFAFPSGLVIYWLTNNLLTMVQQGLYLRYKRRQQEGVKGGKEKIERKEKSARGGAKSGGRAPKGKGAARRSDKAADAAGGS